MNNNNNNYASLYISHLCISRVFVSYAAYLQVLSNRLVNLICAPQIFFLGWICSPPKTLKFLMTFKVTTERRS